MAGFELLQELTERFLDRHWQDSICGERPIWSEPFLAAAPGPYPHHDKQGCYALFKQSTLWYVGLGASRGSGKYKGQGIGARLKHVVKVDWETKSPDNRRMYRVLEDWDGVTHIATIGFPLGFGYLAASLECFLLGQPDLKSTINKIRAGAV